MSNTNHPLAGVDLSGPWLMHEERVKALFARIQSMPARADRPDKADGMDPCDPASNPKGYATVGGVAIIPVCGVLTKYAMPEAWMDEWCGTCPTMPIIDTLNRALADWTVRSILFVIDSGGGMVAGTNMLAEAIAAADKVKPCYAAVSDLAASGGYYIASQCRSITCNAMGEVGCIGVYCVLTDDSQFWGEMGVKFHVVSSGGVKGLGADGAISQELIDDERRGVMAKYDKFVADVATGRGIPIERARQLGDGRCWIAPEALKLGLIDSVASVDAAVSAATQETQRMNAEAFKAYAAANPEAAEVKELITKGIASGKAAGAAEATTAERNRVTGILGAHGLTDHAAVASITAGHDVETATVIATTASRARAEAEASAKAQAEAHKAEVARLQQEIEKAKFEASGAKPIGTALSTAKGADHPKSEADFEKIDDQKERAKAEYAADFGGCKSDFASEGAYVGFRVAQLRGLVKTKAPRQQ